MISGVSSSTNSHLEQVNTTLTLLKNDFDNSVVSSNNSFENLRREMESNQLKTDNSIASVYSGLLQQINSISQHSGSTGTQQTSADVTNLQNHLLQTDANLATVKQDLTMTKSQLQQLKNSVDPLSTLLNSTVSELSSVKNHLCNVKTRYVLSRL